MNIKIIYETQNGNTQYVAEVMQKILTQHGHEVSLHSPKYNGLQPDLTNTQALLFGAPTYDDGYLEKTMRDFITQFNPDLSQHKVAVFGLGNRIYPQFCKSADFLEEWVKKNNGVPVVSSLRIDNFPDDLSPIEQWIGQLHQTLV